MMPTQPQCHRNLHCRMRRGHGFECRVGHYIGRKLCQRNPKCFYTLDHWGDCKEVSPEKIRRQQREGDLWWDRPANNPYTRNS